MKNCFTNFVCNEILVSYITSKCVYVFFFFFNQLIRENFIECIFVYNSARTIMCKIIKKKKKGGGVDLIQRFTYLTKLEGKEMVEA